jgi:hypothetical protein
VPLVVTVGVVGLRATEVIVTPPVTVIVPAEAVTDSPIPSVIVTVTALVPAPV